MPRLSKMPINARTATGLGKTTVMVSAVAISTSITGAITGRNHFFHEPRALTPYFNLPAIYTLRHRDFECPDFFPADCALVAPKLVGITKVDPQVIFHGSHTCNHPIEPMDPKFSIDARTVTQVYATGHPISQNTRLTKARSQYLV
jgi:hypothetical protein